eukprot:748606-Amorphochlora_amoeboformis.AAC.1
MEDMVDMIGMVDMVHELSERAEELRSVSISLENKLETQGDQLRAARKALEAKDIDSFRLRKEIDKMRSNIVSR